MEISVPLPRIWTDFKVVLDELSIESLDTQSLQMLELWHELQKISSVEPSVVQVKISQVYEL